MSENKTIGEKFTKNQKANLRRKKRLIEARKNPDDNWSLIYFTKKARKQLRQINNYRRRLNSLNEKLENPQLTFEEREKLCLEIKKLESIISTKQHFYVEARKEAKLLNK